MRLFSNRSQRTSKCGKNISDTLGCALCATFLFLPHFDIICDLLLNSDTLGCTSSATFYSYHILTSSVIYYRTVTHSAAPHMPLFCSYHTLTSSVIYYWTDARQLGIYLLNINFDGLTFLTALVLYSQSDYLNHSNRDSDWLIVACFMRV